jgi:hypothetical protein
LYLLLRFKAPVASQAKLRKQTWKNTCKKFQEIEKQNKDKKKGTREVKSWSDEEEAEGGGNEKEQGKWANQ